MMNVLATMVKTVHDYQKNKSNKDEFLKDMGNFWDYVANHVPYKAPADATPRLQWCLENQCGKADTCEAKHTIHHPAECPEIEPDEVEK